MTTLSYDRERCRYRALIGTGGIGSGVFFALSGNHTLGREESRSGRFVDRKDYCKLHITVHYVRTLLGPDFVTIPLGKVGDDAPGRQLLGEMDAAGLDLRHVDAEPGEQTLYSFCFVYPDSSGGNLTVDDSACARVDPDFIRQAEPDFAAFADGGLALALPEVSLAARAELLELGTRHGFFRAASFLSAEMAEVRSWSLLDKVDLLAVNVDEARALTGLSANPAPEKIAAAAVETLQHYNPKIQLSMTAGSQGSWTWDGSSLTHLPAYPVPVASTAGAGDAHLAGILVGLVVGLSLSHAQELGALVAALSVTSPHTINFAVSRQALATLAESVPASLSSPVRALLAP